MNTSFIDGTTQAFFGDGITVNGVTVNSPTSATANISVAAGATPGFRTVTLVTEGETAAIVNGFTVAQTAPFIQFVSPSSAAQGATLDLTVVGSLTNFAAATVFDFGPGVTVNTRHPERPRGHCERDGVAVGGAHHARRDCDDRRRDGHRRQTSLPSRPVPPTSAR